MVRAKHGNLVRADVNGDDLAALDNEGFKKRSKKDLAVIVGEDSSEEEEEEAEPGGAVDADGDDDMFADLEEEAEKLDEADDAGPQEKEVRLLEVEEILKLEENDIESVAEDGGVKFTSFGLKEELEEGKFDENENFVRHDQDKDLDQDNWLEGINKSDIDRAKKSHELRAEQEKLSRKNVQFEPIGDLLGSLIPELLPSETPKELLQRIHLANKKKKLKEVRARISELTGTINKILAKGGFEGIYDMTKEQLMRHYKNETGKEMVMVSGKKRNIDQVDRYEDLNSDKVWEFKWLNKENIYGPYTWKEINGWKNSYFKGNVEVRRIDLEVFVNIVDWK